MLTVSIIVLGVLFVHVPQPLTAYAEFFPNDAVVTVFCKQTALSCCDVGNGKIVQCSWNSLQNTLACCQSVDGVSVKFCGTLQDFHNLQQRLNLQQADVVQIDNLTVVCGTSNKIQGGVLVDGAKVNIQMAFDGTTITIGSPLILEGY